MSLPSMLTEHRDAVTALCQRTAARRLDVFGSAVRPDFDAQRSDLDFVVVFDELPPIENSNAYFVLKQGLESIFARPVDLVVERAIRNPHFKSRVQAERQPVYAA
jgi:uncharacterized protein